jgi:glycosyltransferase involved in cell wall biosynthesis
MSALRVLFVMSVGERRGGAEQMLLLLLRHLDRERVAPQIVFLEDGPFARETAAMGVPTRVIDAGRLRQLRRGRAAIARLSAVMRSERPDACVAWMGKSHLYAGPAARLAGGGATVVWWLHTIPSGDVWDRLTLALPSTAVGASSRAAAGALASMRPRRPTFVVHPGVEDDRPADWRALRARRRAELGLADGDVLALLSGRFQAQKGQHRLVAAMDLLRHRRPELRAVLLGGTGHGREPAYRPLVGEMIRSRGLGDTVHMVGHTRDPRSWTYAADVVVNATRHENLSLGLLEAAVAERAVVAVGDGGSPEVFEDGASAIVLDAPTPPAIAGALDRLAGDPVLRATLGRGARRRFESAFTAERMARGFEDGLAALATAPGPP